MEDRLGDKLKRRFLGLGGLYYGDRFVIHRDTRIDGGVSFGEGAREAIVVDSKKYPRVNEVYERLKSSVKDNATVLWDVYDIVDKTLRYDEAYANEMAERYPDRKVSLDVFIGNGKGVCRHMALLCGVLLEKLCDEGVINGKASIDRNSIPAIGGHAWCRYTSANGQSYIVDVTQHFIGRLDKTLKYIKIGGYNVWDYYRPEDKPF